VHEFSKISSAVPEVVGLISVVTDVPDNPSDRSLGRKNVRIEDPKTQPFIAPNKVDLAFVPADDRTSLCARYIHLDLRSEHNHSLHQILFGQPFHIRKGEKVVKRFTPCRRCVSFLFAFDRPPCNVV
jgi:hypothetical protein